MEKIRFPHIPDNIKSKGKKASIIAGTLLTAAAIACSSGDSGNDTRPENNFQQSNTPSAGVRPPESSPIPLPTPTIEQNLVNYANKFLRSEFHVGEIGLIEGKPNDQGGIEYTRKIERPDGLTLILSQTNSPDGSLQSIYVLIDGILVPDPPSGRPTFPSANTIAESFTRYFNVQEVNPESFTRRNTDQGRVQLWEIITDNPDGSYNTLSAYAYHPIGKNSSVIGVASCHITPASSAFSPRSCFGQ